jgi:hypothetical protein
MECEQLTPLRQRRNANISNKGLHFEEKRSKLGFPDLTNQSASGTAVQECRMLIFRIAG